MGPDDLIRHGAANGDSNEEQSNANHRPTLVHTPGHRIEQVADAGNRREARLT